MSDFPIRQKSCHGYPPPLTTIDRTCATCGAGFIPLAPGKTGERGLWTDTLRWFCSQECHDAKTTKALR